MLKILSLSKDRDNNTVSLLTNQRSNQAQKPQRMSTRASTSRKRNRSSEDPQTSSAASQQQSQQSYQRQRPNDNNTASMDINLSTHMEPSIKEAATLINKKFYGDAYTIALKLCVNDPDQAVKIAKLLFKVNKFVYARSIAVQLGFYHPRQSAEIAKLFISEGRPQDAIIIESTWDSQHLQQSVEIAILLFEINQFKPAVHIANTLVSQHPEKLATITKLFLKNPNSKSTSDIIIKIAEQFITNKQYEKATIMGTGLAYKSPEISVEILKKLTIRFLERCSLTLQHQDNLKSMILNALPTNKISETIASKLVEIARNSIDGSTINYILVNIAVKLASIFPNKTLEIVRIDLDAGSWYAPDAEEISEHLAETHPNISLSIVKELCRRSHYSNYSRFDYSAEWGMIHLLHYGHIDKLQDEALKDGPIEEIDFRELVLDYLSDPDQATDYFADIFNNPLDFYRKLPNADRAIDQWISEHGKNYHGLYYYIQNSQA